MRSKHPWTKREKWAMGTVFLATGLLLLLGVGKMSLDKTPNIALPPPAPRPISNGFDVYLAAEKLLVASRPAVDDIDDTQNIQVSNPALAKQRYSVARREAWRNNNLPALDMFQKALRTPCMTPVFSMTNPGFTSFGKFRRLARAKVTEAHLYQMQVRPELAVAASLDGIQMGEDLARGGVTLPKLVSSSLISLARSPLEDFDKTINQLDAGQARLAARRLSSVMRHRTTYSDALQEERLFALREFLELTNSPGWRNSFDSDAPGHQTPLRQKVANYLVSKRQILAEIEAGYAFMQHELAAPYASSRAQLPRPSTTVALVLVVQLNYRSMQAQETVGLDLLLLRLALRAYRADHSGYPQKLAQLSPGYLASIPLDDFSQRRPYHYKLKGSGYLLWSVGPDGVDDGGRPVQAKFEAQPNSFNRPVRVELDSKGDWVAGLNR